MRTVFQFALVLAACGVAASTLWAADPVRDANGTTGAATTAAAHTAAGFHTFRASKIEGLNVRNAAGDKVGSVNDIVLDLHTGKVAYIAMSVGGVLGIGERLFAVPFDQMRLEEDQNHNDRFFVINVSKEKLDKAPGFDKNHWPDFADPHWSQDIDKYYRTPEVKTQSTTRTSR